MSTTRTTQRMADLKEELAELRAAMTGPYVTEGELRDLFGMSDVAIAKMKRSVPGDARQTAGS